MKAVLLTTLLLLVSLRVSAEDALNAFHSKLEINGAATVTMDDATAPSCAVLEHRIEYQDASSSEIHDMLTRSSKGTMSEADINNLAGVVTRYQKNMPERTAKTVHVRASWKLDADANANMKNCFAQVSTIDFASVPGMIWSNLNQQGFPEDMHVTQTATSLTLTFDMNEIDACFLPQHLDLTKMFMGRFADCHFSSRYRIN